MKKSDITGIIDAELNNLSPFLANDSVYFLRKEMFDDRLSIRFLLNKCEIIIFYGKIRYHSVFKQEALDQFLILKDIKEKDFNHFLENITTILSQINLFYDGPSFFREGY